jgi:riboflavin biosynthesis pyrimidine reductase
MSASAESARRRPRVICHMIGSVDGRILTDGWPLSERGRGEYERVHESYGANAWLCGRVTIEEHFCQGVRPDEEIAREHHGGPRDDFRAPGDHASYAFAVDSRGRVAWETNDMGGDHVVAVLSERVSDDYLAFLRGRGVSYVLAGAPHVDLAMALEKIHDAFGVRTLMLEGGGRINGAMLSAGLMDEVSLLIAPVADGRMGSPAVFDVGEGERDRVRLSLKSVERRADGVLWLRYAVGEQDG